MTTATTAQEYADRPVVGELLSPNLLRRLVDYDPATGEFIWRSRSASLFNSDKRDPIHTAKTWNTKCAGKPAFATINVHGYRVACFFGRWVYAHRAAWAIQTGAWPAQQIDHMDGARANNAWANLREVTNKINGRNAKLSRSNASGTPGVQWFARTNRWQARITIDGGSRHIGYFKNLEDAISARKAAQIGHGFTDRHGEVS